MALAIIGEFFKNIWSKHKDDIIDKYKGVNKASLIEVKKTDANKAAIVFIHGFSGDPIETWGCFPQFIEHDPAFKKWDIYSHGYNTSILPDINEIWSANPSIQMLANHFRTTIIDRLAPKYSQIAIVGHSMGGLVTQRAVLDMEAQGQDMNLIHSITLYGTPSGGLDKASMAKQFNNQVADMRSDMDFVKTLRNDWTAAFPSDPPFNFLAVAGDLDQFVPPRSSHEPFDERFRKAVSGNHVDMVKPTPEKLDAYFVLREVLLTASEFYQGAWDSADMAVQMGDFARAKEKLGAKKENLGPGEIVDYAFSLEYAGDRNAAKEFLKEQTDKYKEDSDILGVLAGRWKRSYNANLKPDHADKAMELYQQAYQIAVNNEDSEQIFYHAINLAYLNLKRKKYADAKKYAEQAREHAEKSNKKDIWKFATLAEACLYLDDEAGAFYNYWIALEKEEHLWQRESMYIQWLSIVQQKGMEELEQRLTRVFAEFSK